MNCAEESGFLFKHPCGRLATGQCPKCRKAICNEHYHPTPYGPMCTSCAREEVKRSRSQHTPWHGWDDSPYLYDTYYYRGYNQFGRGHWGSEYYESDFNEGDGSAFHEHGRDQDWEHDMGGS